MLATTLYWLLGIIMVPGILFAAYAEWKIKKTYEEMSRQPTERGQTSNEIARNVLDSNDLHEIQLTTTPRTLGDHYDPKNKTIALSPGVDNNATIASVGIALHEVGHAIQDKDGYAFARLRRFFVPIVNFCSRALWPLVIIGLLLNFGGSSESVFGSVCLWSGVILYGASMIFSLITLPTELDASKRAIQALRNGGYMNEDELDDTKKVLTAAAMTYVASLVNEILTFLRFLLTILILRGKD